MGRSASDRPRVTPFAAHCNKHLECLPMTKHTGRPNPFFDDFDDFDFGFFDRDDRDHDDRGHHEGNEHIAPLPYNATAFPDGVSSGDVTQTSAILWTRAGHTGHVTFQVATDPKFHHIVDVVTVNVADTMVPAKVKVDNLHPDQRYYYR